ncbi:MAG TPA: hypothetical protein VMW17_12235 [Candidatus Binatia bacterium]|nr:hypothetical protein [Candidatus Binatia bacterium]
MNRTTILAIGVIVGAGIALSGCGSDNDETPTAPTATKAATVAPTLSPTTGPTRTASPSATVAPTNTALPPPTLTQTPVDTPSPAPTATDTSTATPSETPSASATATTTPTQTVTVTRTITLSPTITLTPTVTATPTATNTLGPLGIRHFVLDSTQSSFTVKISGGLEIPVGFFRGQTNGQDEPAFLDLEAGQPDANGFVRVNIVAASEYLYVDSKQLAGFVFCLKPLVPVMSAGILGCNGGTDVSISLNQDHHIGQLGVNGFTTTNCTAMQGHVETPYAACSAGLVGQACDVDGDCDTTPGAGDGTCAHVPAACTTGMVGKVCQTNADCNQGTTAGHCGFHGGVCNGPLVPGLGTGDSGPGELFIAPNPDPNVLTNGMPVELGFENALPCGDEGPGMPSPFALTTGHSSSLVTDANNMLGHTLNFDTQGENFDCYNWQSNDKGRLVLSAPAIDQRTVGDVATIFNFFSH